MPELLLQTCVNAAYAASFMALIAVGLVLIFGVMGIINFAHGELYMLGAYAVVYVYADHHLPFWLAVASGLIFVGLLGIAMEHALFRPMRQNPLGGLIVSIGMLLILQALIVAGFGVRMEHIPPPHQSAVPLFGLAGVTIPLQRLITIGAAVVLLGGLWLFLKRSKFGRALRACAQDPEAAALQGISLNQTARMAMFIGAALAGTAGALTAAGPHLPVHGAPDHRHRLHRHHRRRHGVARGRRGGGDPLRLRQHLRDHVLGRRHRRHRGPAADAAGPGGAAARAVREAGACLTGWPGRSGSHSSAPLWSPCPMCSRSRRRRSRFSC
jgi:branched-chain amino acid transport system permease protein